MRAVCLLAAAGAALSACGGGDPFAGGGAERQAELALERRNEAEEISDESFFDLFRDRGDPEIGIAVNRYLWNASLDTLSFLPLESADPFSGLITTGWGGVGGGAYRVTVYISDPALDARSLKVAGFRRAGGAPVPVGEAENRALEDAILTRARQLRIAAVERRG
jgi:hypothetical protein